MCFSASVSFIAATFLAITAFIGLRSVKTSSQWFFACIPLFFSLQQAAEGVVWLTIKNPWSWLHTIAVYTFIIFAFLIWPIWIPLSVFMLEKKQINQTLLKGALALGMLFSSYAAFYLITGTIDTTIQGCHIVYTTSLPQLEWELAIYAVATIGSFFLSSYMSVRFFGILVGLVCLISLLFWKVAFISIWCFFAALLSIIIVHRVRNNELLS
jgi:hypothetical protein